MNNPFRWAALSLAIFVASASLVRAEDKTVNLYAWADYFDPSVFDDFTKDTGIKVTYNTYTTSEALDAHLAMGAGEDDVVVIPGPSLQKAIAIGKLQKLDKSKLPASKALWPEIMAYAAAYDPGNLYAVNYMWFTLGLTFNKGTVEARHEEASLSSWDTIFRPDILQKFADCGVEVQDSPNDLFAAALHYLRLDPRSKSLADLKRASELLYGLRRNVKRFRPAGDLSNLAGGDVCLTLGWSSDAGQARKQALESSSGVTVDYAMPRGGTLILLDNLAIPKGAPHPGAAYALIDFLLRPDIAARDTKVTRAANGVLASKAFLPQEILADPSIYPGEAAMKSFFLMPGYTPVEQAFVTHEWLRVKNGDAKAVIIESGKKPVKKSGKE